MEFQRYARKLRLAVSAHVERSRTWLRNRSLALWQITTEKGLPLLRDMELWKPKRIAFVVVVLLGMASVAYCLYSRRNPRVLEIFVGSVLLSLLLRYLSKFPEGFMEKGLRNGPWTPFIVTVSLLMMLVAWLVYSSNSPKSIKAEIPVIYLIDPTTHDLIGGPLGDSETGSICYFQARQIFQHFKKGNPKAVAAIDSVFTHPTLGDDSLLVMKTFLDFTEYLVIYYLGSAFTTGGADRAIYRRDIPHLLAFPNASIRGEPQPLSRMEGQFGQNLFSGLDLNDIEPAARLEFHVPRDTHMSLVKKDFMSSRLTIKNKSVQISIGIQFLPSSSQGFEFLREWQDGMNLQDLGKAYRALRSFEVYIYYDAAYDRKRYGFARMRDQEEWSQDLLSLLQRKFSWGNPPIAGPLEVHRYLELLNKSRQNQEKRN